MTPEASSLSRQPAQLPEVSAASSLPRSQNLCQLPGPLQPTASQPALQPSAIAGECDSLLSLPQQPGPLPAQPIFRGSHPQGASLLQPAGQPFPWRPLCCSTLLCLQDLLALPQPQLKYVSHTVKPQLNPDVLSCIFVLVECLPPSSVILYSVNFHNYFVECFCFSNIALILFR